MSILDIRYFESDKGSDSHFKKTVGELYKVDKRDLCVRCARLVMQLRSYDTNSDITHLYINLTSDLPHEEVKKSEYPLCDDESYLFFDAGCSLEVYDNLNMTDRIKFFAHILVKALDISFEGLGEKAKKFIDSNGKTGENTEILYFKEADEKYAVNVMMRILSIGKFVPYITVADKDGRTIKRIDDFDEMFRDDFVYKFGSVKIDGDKFTVYPRASDQNVRGVDEPVTFNIMD